MWIVGVASCLLLDLGVCVVPSEDFEPLNTSWEAVDIGVTGFLCQ